MRRMGAPMGVTSATRPWERSLTPAVLSKTLMLMILLNPRAPPTPSAYTPRAGLHCPCPLPHGTGVCPGGDIRG